MLEISYPSHETMFPQNIHGVRHQWSADPSLDLFQVSFESTLLRFRFYTTDRWFSPDAATWATIAQSNAASRSAQAPSASGA